MNQIGLDDKKAARLADNLNDLLANFQLFYQNLRGVHWNIRGENFFQLHLKFEELYTDAQLKIDEIAERVLTLGVVPHHTFSDYLAQAKIKEAKNVSEDRKAVQTVLDGQKVLLTLMRDALSAAADAGDEGTVDLLGGYISQYEKNSWMLAAWLNKK